MEMDPEIAGIASAHEVIAWCMRDIDACFGTLDAETVRKKNPGSWSNTCANVLAVRAAIARLYELEAQPLPFIYMHLMNLTSWVRNAWISCMVMCAPNE